jgi:hypothetical protein
VLDGGIIRTALTSPSLVHWVGVDPMTLGEKPIPLCQWERMIEKTIMKMTNTITILITRKQ